MAGAIGTEKRFPCGRCGGDLAYAPGTAVLACGHCGAENPIPQSEAEIRELDFHAWAAAAEREQSTETLAVTCAACGAQTTFPANRTADCCPFCGTAIVAEAKSQRILRPAAILPFAIDAAAARGRFRSWVAGLWFAPGGLKAWAGRESRLQGLYVPYWTWDSRTATRYSGERGDDYWETEHYTARDAKGGARRRTRQVRKTRWRPASGIVFDRFDDVLVVATTSLPRPMAEALEPWDLEGLEAYRDEFLGGFSAERYSIGLEAGFARAKEIMGETIERSIARDIGGDRQRIHSRRTQYDGVTFKHVLLPVWLSSYRYGEKVYRFLVNGRTGEVQGERPYSWGKIAAFVFALLAAAAGVALLASG